MPEQNPTTRGAKRPRNRSTNISRAKRRQPTNDPDSASEATRKLVRENSGELVRGQATTAQAKRSANDTAEREKKDTLLRGETVWLCATRCPPAHALPVHPIRNDCST